MVRNICFHINFETVSVTCREICKNSLKIRCFLRFSSKVNSNFRSEDTMTFKSAYEGSELFLNTKMNSEITENGLPLITGSYLRSLLLLDHVSDFFIQIALQSPDRVELDF